jgi:hypothetical protein
MDAVGKPTASYIGSKAGKLKYQNFVCGFICACVAHNDQNTAIIGNVCGSNPGIMAFSKGSIPAAAETFRGKYRLSHFLTACVKRIDGTKVIDYNTACLESGLFHKMSYSVRR